MSYEIKTQVLCRPTSQHMEALLLHNTNKSATNCSYLMCTQQLRKVKIHCCSASNRQRKLHNLKRPAKKCMKTTYSVHENRLYLQSTCSYMSRQPQWTVYYQNWYTSRTAASNSRVSCTKYRIHERHTALTVNLNAEYPVHRNQVAWFWQ